MTDSEALLGLLDPDALRRLTLSDIIHWRNPVASTGVLVGGSSLFVFMLMGASLTVISLRLFLVALALGGFYRIVRGEVVGGAASRGPLPPGGVSTSAVAAAASAGGGGGVGAPNAWPSWWRWFSESVVDVCTWRDVQRSSVVLGTVGVLQFVLGFFSDFFLFFFAFFSAMIVPVVYRRYREPIDEHVAAVVVKWEAFVGGATTYFSSIRARRAKHE